MLLTMLAVMAMIQDGPIRTAPEAPAPDPACTFGGRPVHKPGCPTPPGRIDPAAAPPPAEGRPHSTVDFSAYADEAAREAAGATDIPDFDTALALSYGPVAENGVPERAFLDPAWWERDQCGQTPEEACARTARNRLARARAERAETAPVERGAAAPERCRNVWTPAAEGVGGSFSRICGSDEAASARLLEDMRRRDDQTRQDAERDCVRRPETTDQGVRWTLVCGSTANRERANDALDSLLR